MSRLLTHVEARTPSGRLETIGSVVKLLKPEFPDVTISKIRFLESEGLLDPVRTPSGYRKFDDHDIERLQYILRAQRDHFLPLRVIADHLDAIDRGLVPPAVADSTPRVPGVVSEGEARSQDRDAVRVSQAELARESGLDQAQIRAAQDSGLLCAMSDGRHFDAAAVAVARTIAALIELGLDVRHLAANRRAASAQFERVEALVGAYRSSRSGVIPAAAMTQAEMLVTLQARLHAELLRVELMELLRGGAAAT